MALSNIQILNGNKSVTYNGASTITPNDSSVVICCIIPSTDTQISAATDASRSSGSITNLIAITCPAGIPVYGRFTSVTFTSGTGNAYCA